MISASAIKGKGVTSSAAAMLVLVNVSSLNSFGAPYMAPISPFSLSAMRDTFIRASFTRLQKRTARLQDLKGVDMDKSAEGPGAQARSDFQGEPPYIQGVDMDR